ncbi:MAG TPA: FHA domain-containing protein [Anaerolineaceae bacterium]|nr:FHA domain-containing protein [Anaerolineaceae bacterium]HPS33217.1 FHA domain-containing protein [Anaerolineaceae bacterium]
MEYAVLLAQSGPLSGQQWAVRGMLTIGRDEGCQVVIPDRQVSRQHARLSPRDNAVFLEDLNSKNGTYLNGQLLTAPTQLRESDEIRVAFAQTFLFLSSEATLPLSELPGEYLQLFTLQVDADARRVWVRGEEITPPLSAQQFSLLNTLFSKSGEVVSREDLIRAVWGDETPWVTEQAFDALVRRLRDRINQIDPDYDYIVTVRGHGLRLENQPH